MAHAATARELAALNTQLKSVQDDLLTGRSKKNKGRACPAGVSSPTLRKAALKQTAMQLESEILIKRERLGHQREAIRANVSAQDGGSHPLQLADQQRSEGQTQGNDYHCAIRSITKLEAENKKLLASMEIREELSDSGIQLLKSHNTLKNQNQELTAANEALSNQVHELQAELAKLMAAGIVDNTGRKIA